MTPEVQAKFYLRKQKQDVLYMLLSKVNALFEPEDRVAFIYWDKFNCSGWPEQVKSKNTKDWTLEDLAILRSKMSEINFELKNSHLKLDEREIRNAMLYGRYSNTFFDTFCSTYHLLYSLGSGGNGFVLGAMRIHDSQAVAVKFVNHFKNDDEAFVKHARFGEIPLEADILSKIQHPSIIRLIDYCRDSVYSYLVVELFGTSWDPYNDEINSDRNPGLNYETLEENDQNSLNLTDCVAGHDGIPEETIHFIFAQIYDAVLYLHQKGICHGDLKTSNVLIDADYRIKLIDFGVSKLITRNECGEEVPLEDFSGSKIYMPPEMIREEPYLASEAEAWSLGTLLYKLKTSRSPFRSPEEVLNKELTLKSEEAEGKNGKEKTSSKVILGIEDLISKMLTRERTERIKLSEIANNPWMKRFQEQSAARMKSFEATC